jgi:hypothetical protein
VALVGLAPLDLAGTVSLKRFIAARLVFIFGHKIL